MSFAIMLLGLAGIIAGLRLAQAEGRIEALESRLDNLGLYDDGGIR